MVLDIFLKTLDEVVSKHENMDFSELIRNCRETLGIKQYRAAELLGMTIARLKNLETQYFRDMPDKVEIGALSEFYNIDIEILYDKLREHCNERYDRLRTNSRGLQTVHSL